MVSTGLERTNEDCSAEKLTHIGLGSEAKCLKINGSSI